MLILKIKLVYDFNVEAYLGNEQVLSGSPIVVIAVVGDSVVDDSVVGDSVVGD